jgi:gentisate 1,2-dioxygenase
VKLALFDDHRLGVVQIFVVHRGTGHSVIGGQRFAWASGDMFVVPSWSAVEHHAEQTADVFVPQ